MQEVTGDAAATSAGLLTGDDPSPVIALNPGSRSPFLLVGDHAGRLLPRRLGDLGVPAAAMEQHIAWDIGVAALGEKLADMLGCCFISQAYSRLVIDCNRAPGAPGSIVSVSDGVRIPGNAALSPQDVAARQDEILRPYQARIAAELDERAARGMTTVLVSLHSFTPSLGGVARPWRYGVLHRNDSAFSRALIDLLRLIGEGEVGDNQPYAMDQIDYTIPLHVDPRAIEYTEIEVRQDMLASETGQTSAAHFLGRLLPRALER